MINIDNLLQSNVQPICDCMLDSCMLHTAGHVRAKMYMDISENVEDLCGLMEQWFLMFKRHYD